ncbi:hypothetical protein PoB_005985100 [Plakobranchus ocellatus]|uniref:Uncharacterized protein n=1 Tax=Plakobranchus ocellatus TaxID=259542 RepID=A0AAV4CMY5_9GAST|nr:hypothetical protein PoB_005985100 [Plakobranchus ocellatus]
MNRIGSSSVDEDILKQLEFTGMVLARRMGLIEVRRKSTRGLIKIFIILTQERIQACDQLVKTKIHVGLDPENHFLFSRQNCLGSINGLKAMREITNLCERVKEPKLIRSRLLRDYMATTIQILDMSRDEMNTLADHMAHSVAVHIDVYGMKTSLQEKNQGGKGSELETEDPCEHQGNPANPATPLRQGLQLNTK